MFNRLFILIFLVSVLSSCNKEDADACLNRELISETWSCPEVYDPVCGCDGVSYTNACIAKFKYGIRSFTEGGCNCSYPESGLVVEIGEGPCAKLIRLESGQYLFPEEIPTGFELKPGTSVRFDYESLNENSTDCGLAENVKILCIEEVSCTSIGVYDPVINLNNYNDPIEIVFAQVLGDCLHISFNYTGSCQDHQFRLSRESFTALTTDISLVLEHEGNEDTCTNSIAKTMSFDLINLQISGANNVNIILRSESSSTIRPFHYIY